MQESKISTSTFCPRCGAELALTTLHGYLMRLLEGPFAGMFECQCTKCSWSVYAQYKIAKTIRLRKGTYSK